jgi:hypothetical protein
MGEREAHAMLALAENPVIAPELGGELCLSACKYKTHSRLRVKLSPLALVGFWKGKFERVGF